MKTAKQVHEEVDKAFHEGDFAKMLSLFSETCVVREAPGLPFGGDHVGREAIQRMFASLNEVFEMSPTLLDVFEVSDSLVITYMSMHFTSRVTGESVDMPVLEMLTVRDGMIVEAFPFYWDTHRLALMATGASASSA
jgi:ketosteroid isomerase-like protein